MLCNACARNVVMNGVGDRVVRNVGRAYWQYAFEGSEKTLQNCAGLFFVVSCTTPLIFGCVYSSVVSCRHHHYHHHHHCRKGTIGRLRGIFDYDIDEYGGN